MGFFRNILLVGFVSFIILAAIRFLNLSAIGNFFFNILQTLAAFF